MTNQVAETLNRVSPTAEDVLGDTAAFSPIRWKTGWPHHLRRVPPFRDDAHATITHGEVFEFAADVRDSGWNRDQIIDFLGAAFAYLAGQSNEVMQMQAFLRNKGNAAKLLSAIRTLQEVTGPEAAYEALAGTGLAPKYASGLAYFLAGPQQAGDAKPIIYTEAAAGALGASGYAEYLAKAAEAAEAAQATGDGLPLDAVEYALSKGENKGD